MVVKKKKTATIKEKKKKKKQQQPKLGRKRMGDGSIEAPPPRRSGAPTNVVGKAGNQPQQKTWQIKWEAAPDYWIRFAHAL
jgi:hypothetical protein